MKKELKFIKKFPLSTLKIYLVICSIWENFSEYIWKRTCNLKIYFKSNSKSADLYEMKFSKQAFLKQALKPLLSLFIYLFTAPNFKHMHFI